VGSISLADASRDESCGQASSCHLYFSSSAGGLPGFGTWGGNGTLILFVA
jgi:hypothetical protein